MKKVLKLIGKFIIGVAVICLLCYSAFRLTEYFVGNKYVNYLSENKLVENALDEKLELSFDKEFYDNNFFILGEIHEVSTAPLLDVETFKTLHKNADVRAYLAEIDIAQAYYINRYLKDSTVMNLEEITDESIVWIAMNSEEYNKEKWGKLKAFYQTLPDDEKFEIFGLEQFWNFGLLKKLLIEKLPSDYHAKIPLEEESLKKWLSDNLSDIILKEEFQKQDSLLLRNVEFNIKNPNKASYRDEFCFENFKRYYKQNNWLNQKVYACFGLYHALQGDKYSLAHKIKESKIYQDKVVSIFTIYTDSYFTVPSSTLPSFIQDEGAYTKLPLSYDNLLLFYVRGIEDFKRTSAKNAITLYKLDAENSPYRKSDRGLKNFRLLPIWGAIETDPEKVTTDYGQYLYFVNGADWMQPKEN